MPLRSPNNPNTDISIMNTLKTLLINDRTSGQPNTQIGIDQQTYGQPLVYVQQKYKMSLLLGQASAPQMPQEALLLTSGHQSYGRRGQMIFEGSLSIYADYYMRWDEQAQSIDNIWKTIAADLELIKANLEDDDSTAYGGTNQTMSVPQIMLAPYEDQYDKEFPGLTLVFRRMTIVYNLLPYR